MGATEFELRPPDPGVQLANQLIALVERQDVEHAVTTVSRKMQEEGLAHRRFIAETFGIPVRMALLFDGKFHNEIEILSYETGLSTQFLEGFQEAAQNLNVSPTDSVPIIVMLSGKLTELEWLGPAGRQLNMMRGGPEFMRELVGFMKAGDVQTAVERVLKTMQKQSPDARRYIAQVFGIPESTVLIYDELRKQRFTTGANPISVPPTPSLPNTTGTSPIWPPPGFGWSRSRQ